MTLRTDLTATIIVVTLTGVAIGRYPRLRMNRATSALVSAALLILIGAIALPDAYAALDMNTLAPPVRHDDHQRQSATGGVLPTVWSLSNHSVCARMWLNM